MHVRLNAVCTSNALPIVLLFQCAINCSSIPKPYQLFLYSNALPIVLLFQCPTNCSFIPLCYQLFLYRKVYSLIHVYSTIRAGKKVWMFDPSFIRAFKAKFLLLKLRCHVNFNVWTCAIVQFTCVVNNVGIFQKGWGCLCCWLLLSCFSVLWWC